MSENRIRVNAPAEALFDVLVDPASYVLWVVGAKHVRGVDAGWPQPGTKLHHTFGVGPLEDRDTTEVLEIERPHRLVVRARAWPFGTAKVELTLTPDGDTTTLQMKETPEEGVAATFKNPLMEAILFSRNVVALLRLRRWTEERYRGTPGHLPTTGG